MAETRCPACGHSPIPEGAEACPRCDEPFNFLPMYKRGQRKFQDSTDAEDFVTSTVQGSLSGALSVHPGPAATALFIGAALWTARALGLLGDAGDAALSFVVAGLDVVLAVALLLNLGPVKLVVQAGMVLQLLLALYLAHGRNELHHLFFGLHALAILGMTVGEPGSLRRWLGLTLAAVFAVGGLVTFGRSAPRVEPEAPQISSSTLGFTLRLPATAAALEGPQLAPALELPTATLTGESFGFGEASTGTTGVITAERQADAPLPTRCQTLHRELGGKNAPRPVAKEAPRALGTSALSYELVTAASTGYLSCARFDDGRFYGFAVTVKDRQAAQATFDRFGDGLSISQ